jgi:hypothetical protein
LSQFREQTIEDRLHGLCDTEGAKIDDSFGEDLGIHRPKSFGQLSGGEIIACGQRCFEFVAPARRHDLLEC